VTGQLNRTAAGDDDGGVSYDDSKNLARDHDGETRRRLAARRDVRPEILYYLAADALVEVRREIATNISTPRHADRLLVDDVDDEVRCELARKIARLAPDLGPGEKDQVYKLTVEILDTLAHDELPRVRQIVSEEIKRSDSIPRNIVEYLARDVELVVSAPVLQYSPLLNDRELLEIIESDPIQGALAVISKRERVPPPVADAIAGRGDESAIAALLANPSAQIREETLDSLLDRAPQAPSWHKPLVERPELSLNVVRRIAKFVALALLRVLDDRNDLPEEAAAEVRQAVARRIDQEGVNGGTDAGLAAEKAFAEGRIDDEMVQASIIKGDHDFVTKALALKAGLPAEVAARVISMQGVKSITALVWKAGLGMRTAIQVQLRVAHVPPMDVLNAKDGTDYPLTEEELEWHADLFAI
jgi:uncharacterized protein (DUF2336 family)